jgi:hypothetical protein
MFDTDGSGAIGSEELKGAMLRVIYILLFFKLYFFFIKDWIRSR